jgi:hypothetical protein
MDPEINSGLKILTREDPLGFEAKFLRRLGGEWL